MNDWVVHCQPYPHLLSATLPASGQTQAGVSEDGHSLALRHHGPDSPPSSRDSPYWPPRVWSRRRLP
jgi:hypothetical protein